MKLAVCIALVFCSAVTRDHRVLPEAPLFALPESAPELLLNRLPRRIVDPTAMIQAAALKHNVRPALVKSIVAVESAFNANAISARGALGLMQLMPQVAREYGIDPFVPEQNIEAGTRYLRSLLEKYGRRAEGIEKAIAAYNAGQGAVDRYDGVPPYEETQGYVTRVLAYMRQYETP